MKETISKLVHKGLLELGVEDLKFTIEHPVNLAFGDYSTNAGLVYKNAPELLSYIEKNLPRGVERVELKGGFINFYLTKEFFAESLSEIIDDGADFGRNDNLKGEKTIVEYTDPNPFKEFHIGHLMSNAIGEALSRILEWNGAEVNRACYQGDVGIHVAKAIYGYRQTSDWKNAYTTGVKAFEEDEVAKAEIVELNKKIYERSDESLNKIYDIGRELSLREFEVIYKKLGTKFDHFFYESETGRFGKELVEKNVGKVFEESDGAVIFKGEKFNSHLHTRVFINSQGLPTYEAKELGLAKVKFDTYSYERSVVITGNEVDAYFDVLMEALRQIYPELAEKTHHISHGMLRLPTGKMSSRTGDVITAEDLLEKVKETIAAKGNTATDDIAVGAVKYMILKQAPGGDIIFDLERSVSTEGDSGPYLQYTYARTNTLLEKAGDKLPEFEAGDRETHEVEKLLYRFPEIVERAHTEYAPQYITTYLTELAGSFNNFYQKERVISDDAESGYRLAITKAFNIVIKNGLDILGIPTPSRL
jgi:arginyl-tRNA synthetase